MNGLRLLAIEHFEIVPAQAGHYALHRIRHTDRHEHQLHVRPDHCQSCIAYSLNRRSSQSTSSVPLNDVHVINAHLCGNETSQQKE